ncbi:MAG: hypothetical protein JNK60_15345, partial [Acidobacteria bacterium]|nr:hypothetical protein [Acidobacteriota bacterium]
MVRLFRPLPWLVGLVAVFGITVWLTLGMHRGLLLSGAIRTKVWPWAPFHPPVPLTAQVLSDPLWMFVPWMDFTARELRAGRIPLWNPHQEAGVPLLANAQSAVGSPLLWPGFLLGVERGWNPTLIAKVLIAFLGTYLWLRDRRRSPPAALLGALAVAISGSFIAWLAHPLTLTAAAVPFLLLFGGRFAERATRRDAAGLFVSTYVVLSGGHPESAPIVALLAAAAVAVRSPSFAGFVRTGAVAFLGALLAAPLLLPFVEYLLASEAISGLS